MFDSLRSQYAATRLELIGHLKDATTSYSGAVPVQIKNGDVVWCTRTIPCEATEDRLPALAITHPDLAEWPILFLWLNTKGFYEFVYAGCQSEIWCRMRSPYVYTHPPKYHSDDLAEMPFSLLNYRLNDDAYSSKM